MTAWHILAASIWDIFQSPLSWNAISLRVYAGIAGFILMLVGGLLLVRWERRPALIGLALLVSGSAALLWGLGVI